MWQKLSSDSSIPNVGSITHVGAEEIGAGGEGIGSPKDSSKAVLRSKNALEKFNLLNIF